MRKALAYLVACRRWHVVASVLVVAGCADTSPIMPAASTRSQFAGAVYQDETVTLSSSTFDTEEFRVFHQGATSFVSIQTIRASAEQRAGEFCDRRGKTVKSLRETTSKPPHILGNFPRIELILACVDRAASSSGAPASADAKYTKLINLKKLLDNVVLSHEEFDREKS